MLQCGVRRFLERDTERRVTGATSKRTALVTCGSMVEFDGNEVDDHACRVWFWFSDVVQWAPDSLLRSPPSNSPDSIVPCYPQFCPLSLFSLGTVRWHYPCLMAICRKAWQAQRKILVIYGSRYGCNIALEWTENSKNCMYAALNYGLINHHLNPHCNSLSWPWIAVLIPSSNRLLRRSAYGLTRGRDQEIRGVHGAIRVPRTL
jgi:hypothetical protein